MVRFTTADDNFMSLSVSYDEESNYNHILIIL